MKWRHTWLIAGCLVLAIYLGQSLDLSTKSLLLAPLFSVALMLLSIVIMLVAYTERDTRQSSKAAMVVAWLLVLLLGFETTASVLHHQTRVEVARALANTEFAKVEYDRDGFMVLEGIIGMPSATSLAELAARTESPLLVLNSNGGSIEAAMLMANTVRERELIVLVAGECSSACVLVALASPHLAALPSARFGFHQGSVFGNSRSGIAEFWAQSATDLLMSELRRGGIPESILAVAEKTPPQQMHYVSAQRMHELGVVNAVMQ